MTQLRNRNNTISGNSNYINSSKALLATSFAMLSGFAMAGSGGVDYSRNSLSRQNPTSLSILIESTVNKKNSVSSCENSNNLVITQLEFIKNTFGLYDDDFAEACHVTRGTLTNWKSNNSIPRDKSRERVFELYTIAKDWREQNFSNKRELIATPLVGDESVLRLLQAENLNKQKILFAGRRLFRQSLKNNKTVLL